MIDGLQAIRDMSPNTGIMGEDVRGFVQGRGIYPHHFNAWGALIMAAIRKGYLVPTGAYKKNRHGAAHARRNAVYTLITSVLLLVVMGCAVPLIPVSEQWRWPEHDKPLPFPSPAIGWQGGFMGGPVHE